jgi:hypothetical protein
LFKEKSIRLVKKLKALLKAQKAQKWPKPTFDKNLKMKLLPKNTF